MWGRGGREGRDVRLGASVAARGDEGLFVRVEEEAVEGEELALLVGEAEGVRYRFVKMI